MRHTNLGRKIKAISYIALVIFLVVAYIFFKKIQNEYLAITTFSECVGAGYPVIPTYPEECKIPGKVFVNTSQTATKDTVTLATTTSKKNTDAKNISYDIEGENITLEEGEALSENKTIRYFGNELRLDIDGDDREDTLLLLTAQNSGSSTFYYLVAALNKEDEYVGTNGILIGDRITPKTTEFKNNEIVVNYLERKTEEPMNTKPSVMVSRHFKVVNETLTEITK
jgi:hypothetical protein